MAKVIHIEQFDMPERALPDGLNGDALRVASVYNQINEGLFDMSNPEDQDVMLAEFVGRETFVVRGGSESDDYIRGIALYTPETEPKVSKIIGLAVDKPYRGEGIGSFLVANLIMISRENGQKAIDVIAVEPAREFWSHKGFEPIKPRVDGPSLTTMRLIL